MCGRFSLATPMDQVAAMFGCEPLSDTTPFSPSWNVAPTALVPVMTQAKKDEEAQAPLAFNLMRWGFRPSWSKASHREPINARLETAHDKPMFRSAMEQRRGVVAADGWYEWMTTPRGKVPYYHQRLDGQMCLFAVIWDTWQGEESAQNSFALLTRAANPDCEAVHDRMPVLLTPKSLGPWLGEGTAPAKTPTSTVNKYPVSGDVNRTSTDHAGLTKPIPTLFDQEYGV
jgi:putative SOS response-associated peptidase YedK